MADGGDGDGQEWDGLVVVLTGSGGRFTGPVGHNLGTDWGPTGPYIGTGVGGTTTGTGIRSQFIGRCMARCYAG
ncbi:hypothetical protein KI387_003943 [Taxus chinensis]|uniref:Uncharacterized protein n=1 Tax=Taxus chinensis TaxID=29808 RepID=A0AA38LR78_TAXCH|nr:hypothetical protein KI387_003943 [Taxus chinensis]